MLSNTHIHIYAISQKLADIIERFSAETQTQLGLPNQLNYIC